MEKLIPSPAKMAENLRVYALTVTLIPVLMEKTNARSIRDVERHLVTAYVKRVSGDWHDADVSAIIAAATGRPLDPDTQKKWRVRNYAGINLPLDLISTMAEALSLQGDKKE